MSKAEKSFRLPDQTATTDIKKMIKAWHDLSRPIEELTGLRLLGFDPGLLLTGNNTSFDCPLWLAEAFNSGIEKVRRDVFREGVDALRYGFIKEWGLIEGQVYMMISQIADKLLAEHREEDADDDFPALEYQTEGYDPDA